MTETKFRGYTSAPLPFMGQKRRFVPDFKEALKLFNEKTVFVDLFGGSGLLSHVAKRERPDARVVYNDFDDYHVRLANVERTNHLLSDLKEIAIKVPREKQLPPHIRGAVLERIRQDKESGFVDYITLSSSLLFSIKYVESYEELSKATMYNRIRKDGYNCSGYLDGLEIVKYDYKELFAQYKDQKNVVFFVDPPYLSTETGTYRGYWKLADYLDVLQCVKDVSFMYFTSEKSSIIELLDWISDNSQVASPFNGAIQKETRNRLNYQSSYKDIMLYKKAG